MGIGPARNVWTGEPYDAEKEWRNMKRLQRAIDAHHYDDDACEHYDACSHSKKSAPNTQKYVDKK